MLTSSRSGGIIGLLLGAFLMGCAGQTDKPVDLSITEPDPGRCGQAWLNFENYRADIQERNQNIQVEILTGTAAQIFLAAYNVSPPPSNFRGNRVALFTAPGIAGTLVAIISKNNCVKMAAVYKNIAVQMWRLGRPGFPSSFQAPNVERPKKPSI